MPFPGLHFIWNGGSTDTPMKPEAGGKFSLDGEWTESVPEPATWRWDLSEVR